MGLPGRVRTGAGLLLTLAVVGGLALGWRPTGTSSVAASENRSSTAVVPQNFLPILLQTYAAPFLDDFSNPSSGWPILQTSYGTWGYVNGEYRMQVLQPGYELRAGHNLYAGDFHVKVSARSDTLDNAGYGLYFAFNGNIGYYVFEVDPWLGRFFFYRWDFTQTPPARVFIINGTPNSAILINIQTNLLEVTRSGTTISMFANGNLLATVVDGTLGPGLVGMDAAVFPSAPPAEVFFDNFAFVNNTVQPLVARSGARSGSALPQDGSTGSISIDGTGASP